MGPGRISVKSMEKEIKGTKGEIRKRILMLRDYLSDEERDRAAVLLTEKLLGHQWFYGSEIFLGFVSYGSEINTREILLEALKAGKRVYVPKVIPGKEYPEMCFYRITGMEELEEGYRGIPEPSGRSERYVYAEATSGSTLMLMPGVAFDVRRNRIGYGKGFYDRFLEDKPGLQLRTIAVGYHCQMVEELPAEDRDIKPCQVICV